MKLKKIIKKKAQINFGPNSQIPYNTIFFKKLNNKNQTFTVLSYI